MKYIDYYIYSISSHHSKDSVLMCRTVAKMLLDINSAFNFIQYVCSARTFRKEFTKMLKSMFRCCITRCNKSNAVGDISNVPVITDAEYSQNDVITVFKCCSQVTCKKANTLGDRRDIETNELQMSKLSSTNRKF